MTQHKRPAHNAGFTLVELMVVVVILALLATGGTVAYNKFLKSAAAKTAQSKCKELESAIESYVNSNFGKDIPNGDEIWARLVEEKYLKDREIPKDPWNEAYQVTRDEEGDYRVWSKGEDKQPDTDDDIDSRGVRSERDDF